MANWTGSYTSGTFNLANGDHITGNTTFGNGAVVTASDSATIYVDGNYSITFTSTAVVTLAKIETTRLTFCGNNRTTAGTMGLWVGFINSLTTTGTLSFQYIRIQDATTPMSTTTTVGYASYPNIHHLWIENCTNLMSFGGSNAPGVDVMFRNVFYTACGTGKPFVYPSFDLAYDLIHSRIWAQNCAFTSPFTFQSKNIDLQDVRDCVSMSRVVGNSTASNRSAGYLCRVQDSYIQQTGTGNMLVGGTTDAGTNEFRRCQLANLTACSGSAGVNTTVFNSAFNDAICLIANSSTPYINSPAGHTAVTSDNDFISGYNNAPVGTTNPDTSSGVTTSTATPQQFAGLTTNRTNAKTVRNRPLVIDNVVVGTPTSTGVTITADSQNGSVAGQGSTTVDADSAAAQATLNVADTTGFELGELVEVAYGTASFELLRILSINAGVSITFETNMAFSHQAADAHTVKKHLRHFGLPFVMYGTVSGVYTMQTQVPPETIWGQLFTGITTTYNGKTHTWQRYGHSVALTDLEPATGYYYKFCAYTPFGELMESSEGTFTTAPFQGFAA